jgi:hypothetical protein
MKKKLLGTAITAVLMAGNAHAALPTIDPATTTVVYLSGASASLDYINKLITSSAAPVADRFCDNTAEIWRFNDNIDGKTQNAFYCTKSAGNAALANAKSHLLIYKRSEGGSGQGVDPIIKNTPINFLNVTANPTCAVTTAAVAGTTVGAAKCTYDTTGVTATQITSATPNFGMSDVDPVQFRGNNVEAGYTPVKASDLKAITVKGASAVVFGEPVTLQLYLALQAAQKATGQLPSTCVVGDRATESCMPNLTSAQIASIHSGSWADWNGLKVGTTGLGLYDWAIANPALATAPGAVDLHVCRRVDGSGTQAQHGIVFLNSPCASASAATPPAHDSTLGEGVGITVVHEMSTSGGVSDCLKILDTGVQIAGSAFDGTATGAATNGAPRWAVGIQSLEKNSTNFEFVKVDGVAPTLAHVVDGTYHDWVENTFQYNTAAYLGFPADVKAVVDTVIAKAALPEVMAALNTGFTHGFGNGAYLAVPSLFTPAANGAFDATRPVNPYSRAVAPNVPVENCRVPTIWNSGAAKL